MNTNKLYQASDYLDLARGIWRKAAGPTFTPAEPTIIPPVDGQAMIGAGVTYKERSFITHTTLDPKYSALTTATPWQKAVTYFLLLLAAYGFAFHTLTTAQVIIAALSVLYFIDMTFNLFLILKSLHCPSEIAVSGEEIESIDESKLPMYTILCPMYREEAVIRNLLDSLARIDWPKDKLDVILLLEQDDTSTIAAARSMSLPPYVRVLVVPHSQPKTKPKACNYGLAHAKGEYLVIFDAEDVPDPLQLKKVYLAYQKVPRDVKCIQAKLNYYNPSQNLLTRLFTAEYSLWFDVILTGLQTVETTIPLGGTSNHFRTRELLELEGWDPFNVTEDCDLGVRLFKRGGRTAIIESVTLEEANSNLKNWLRQRSRWVKGYMQTYLVHMRDPISFIRAHGWHALFFQLNVGGKIGFMLINPLLWLLTFSYFAFYPIAGPTIEELYPPLVFYTAVTSFVFGNFLFLYYYMIGVAKREYWWLTKYVFLIPFYWLMASVAAGIALYQLFFRPHYWEKTIHGLTVKAPARKPRWARLAPALPLPALRLAAISLPRMSLPAISLPAVSLAAIKAKVTASGVAAGGVLVVAGMAANFLHYLFNAYLGRAISLEDFGLLSSISSFLLLTSVPFSSLSRTVAHKTAYCLGKYDGAIRSFWSHTRHRAILIGVLLTAAWLALAPSLSAYLNSPSLLPFILFSPAWLVAIVFAVDEGFLYGTLKFKVLALAVVLEASSKLLVAWGLVSTANAQFVYSAIPISMMAALGVAYTFARKAKTAPGLADDKSLLTFPKTFFASSALIKVSAVSYLTVDVILAKHFLDPAQAGQYALIALVGKMIFFVGGLLGQFVVPVISKEEGAGTNSEGAFSKLLLASSASSLSVYLVVGLLGAFTAPILLGSKISPVTYLLPAYGFGMLCFSVASVVTSFHQVRNKHVFSVASFVLALVQVAAISVYHDSLQTVVLVMSALGMASLLIVGSLHFLVQSLSAAVARTRPDFSGLFSLVPVKDTLDLVPIRTAVDATKLRILMFNWRDTRHVWAGGAEIYLHEIAKRLVGQGHEVTLFCGNDRKNPRYETIDGVQIVRRGGFYTVYLWAFLYYLFKFRNNCDVIIDSENGIPFFTPAYAKQPVIGLVHHVHQEVFRQHLARPLAMLACLLEAKLMPLVYRNSKMITVSDSSRQDMRGLGFGQKEEIEIVHPGVEVGKYSPAPKTAYPSVLYLGRLKPYKSIDTLIRAMGEVVQQFPNAKLRIAGFGESRESLEALTSHLKLGHAVQFLGKVSEELKVKLLGESWVFVYPSSMEGWGIAAIEANASGTPVIAADVPGLRDSVRNPESGFLVPFGQEHAFAQQISQVLGDAELRQRLVQDCLDWAKRFTWEQSADKLLKILQAQQSAGSPAEGTGEREVVIPSPRPAYTGGNGSHRRIEQYIDPVLLRCQGADNGDAAAVLREFRQATAYRPEDVIALPQYSPVSIPSRRNAQVEYGSAVVQALKAMWEVTNRIGSRRLAPFIPELLSVLERHGEIELEAEAREQLLRVGPSTIDRRLRPYRRPEPPLPQAQARPFASIKFQVPIRILGDWQNVAPGLVQAGLVHHGGPRMEGVFLNTLLAVDVRTSWIGLQPVWGRGRQAGNGLACVRQGVPFMLRELSFGPNGDKGNGHKGGNGHGNGKESLNGMLLPWCKKRCIRFTRGWPYEETDQVYIAQKNWALVRQLVGYDRYCTKAAYRQMQHLYRLVTQYINFFQPVTRLLAKEEVEGKVRRIYDPAQTPYQRLLATNALGDTQRQSLEQLYRSINPVQLLADIQRAQTALHKLAYRDDDVQEATEQLEEAVGG
ncbi:MAG: glycosyltransferase [Bacteroidetes bacterium]|nr:glycosyltransferase [Bacteroidota bacterium]